MFSLAQRRHIVTLVDRAMQEDGISLNHAAENLQVSLHSVSRWCAALQDTTNPPGSNIVKNQTGPAGYLDDIQEQLIDFVTDWRDRGMPVTCFTDVCKIGQLKPNSACDGDGDQWRWRRRRIYIYHLVHMLFSFNL